MCLALGVYGDYRIVKCSKYDRPTEDRLANTSRTEDWFTESLYNKKVLELENLWRLARSYNHKNPYILGEGETPH